MSVCHPGMWARRPLFPAMTHKRVQRALPSRPAAEILQTPVGHEDPSGGPTLPYPTLLHRAALPSALMMIDKEFK